MHKICRLEQLQQVEYEEEIIGSASRWLHKIGTHVVPVCRKQRFLGSCIC